MKNHFSPRRRSLFESLEIRQLLSTIYVDAGLTASTHDGTTWATAFIDLQQALTAANSGDQIDVAGGTYKPTAGTDRTISFQLKSGVAVYGGFAGSASSDPTTRDPSSYPTVLSGDIGTAGDVSDNSYHVVIANGADSTSLLDGVTITEGYAANPSQTLNVGASVANYGGGMYCNGSPAINDCVFIHNSTGNFDGLGGTGGAIAITGAPQITNCSFFSNLVTSTDFPSAGGAAYVFDSGVPSFTNCVFVGNGAYNGGAIGAQSSATMKLNNCDFTGNFATAVGGAIYVIQFGPTANNSIFWGDSAPSDPELGGMYPVSPSSAAVTYSDVAGGFLDTGNINADPQFTANPSPGMDGIWGTADDDYGNLQLQQTSPAIDAGNNSAVPSTISSDLARHPRFLDIPSITDTGSGTAPLVDMGAYETLPPALAIAGGPYTVIQSQSITLNGQGLSNVPGALQYAWDWTGNGLFTDATGPSPTFPTTATTPTGIINVSLRVTNANGQSDIDTTTINIEPITVTATAGGPYTVVQGGNITLNGQGTSNLSGPLTYAWDWTGNGQFTDATGINPVFSTTATTPAGPVTVSLRVTNSTGQSDIDTTTINVEAPVVYVDQAAFGANNGSDWADAFNNLATALDQSVAGQTIRVAAGTYYPTTGTDQSATFNLKSGVEIDGGYAGFSGTDPDSRRLDPNMTILSGNIGNAGSNTDDSYHVVTANSVDSSAILDGVTIKDGYANGSDAADTFGGGIYLANSSPTIRNSFLLDNFAAIGGGGIYNSNSSPTISNCIIEDNSANADGGGIRNDDSSPTITGCTIDKNTANGSAGDEAGGGAMANYGGSTPMITACNINANHSNSAGAVYNSSSNPTFSYCMFDDNMASGSAGQGGAMFNSASSPTLTHCTFTANSATVDGGAIYDVGGSDPALTNCILWADTTDSAANEVTNNSSNANITFSDIQGSYAGEGNLNADPLFAAPASAGVDRVWGTSDDYFGALRLLPNSPAINTGNSSAGSTDMGRWSYSTNPIVRDLVATPVAKSHTPKLQLTAQTVAPLTTDAVKSVTIYFDADSNLAFDSSDPVLGKAHHTKNGWELTVPGKKLLPGSVALFAIATTKSGQSSTPQRVFSNVQPEGPAIHKLTAKIKTSKRKSTTLTLKAQGLTGPIERIAFFQDANGNGKLDNADEILSFKMGKKTSWTGVFAGASGTTYEFFARAQGTDGSWGPVVDAIVTAQ